MRLVSIRTRRSLHVISIHAPMKGATSDDSPELWTAAEISIHAPMMGATASRASKSTRVNLNWATALQAGSAYITPASWSAAASRMATSLLTASTHWSIACQSAGRPSAASRPPPEPGKCRLRPMGP